MFKLLVLAAAASLAVSAEASTISWNLVDVNFNDGATATGGFTVNGDTGALLSYDIQTSGTANMAAYHYDGVNDVKYCDNCFAANSFLIANTLGGFGKPLLELVFSLTLTGSGSNALVLGNFPTGSAEITNDGGPHRTIIGGYATTAATDVPEPAMLGLFGMGAIGLGLSRRRRKVA